MTTKRDGHSEPAALSGSDPMMAEVLADPRARRVLEELGIDHCCGTHLTLTQAAAAAGVPPAELRRRLELAIDCPAPRMITLDVRGLDPPLPLVRVLQRLETLETDVTLEMIHDRKPLLLYPQLDARGFTHETSEPEPGLVRVLITRATKSE